MHKTSGIEKIDFIALLLAISTIFLTYFVGKNIYQFLPHIEDEMAYLWQAKVFANFQFTIPTPKFHQQLMTPFVIDYNGLRFGKYAPGWPIVLASAIRLGIQPWINPILSGLIVWVTYHFHKNFLSSKFSLLSILLLITSPFFNLVNGTLLSHTLALFLTTSFCYLWYLQLPPNSKPGVGVLSGITLGFLFITRPFTAILIAIPYFFYGVSNLLHKDKSLKFSVILTGISAIIVGAIQLGWQWVTTGNAFQNLYQLWWSYDKIGFGNGFGVSGHTLSQGLSNLWQSIASGSYELFGWQTLSYIFIPFGIIKIIQQKKNSPYFWILPTILIGHIFYWVGGTLFGPRYYFETITVVILISTMGIEWLWNRLKTQHSEIVIIFSIFFIGLIGINLFSYLPTRLLQMKGLYGIDQSMIDQFKEITKEIPNKSIVIIHPDWWTSYGGLLVTTSPFLDDDLIIAYSGNSIIDNDLADYYKSKNYQTFHYYPEAEPLQLTFHPNLYIP